MNPVEAMNRVFIHFPIQLAFSDTAVNFRVCGTPFTVN
ncbi:hypothetical protein GXM_04739 [Nostoc sphaeroides CCNUC1]|uniref:Uncharacterized protein n=1 Tax=Nostoc sphaeroides CCNUC1 TaxID=2653204 RepID=A0A5P8W5H5_9NOSO|nr:hypothetical protein GXM_04739 [Nostoc sphaeroides CCNUC1]